MGSAAGGARGGGAGPMPTGPPFDEAPPGAFVSSCTRKGGTATIELRPEYELGGHRRVCHQQWSMTGSHRYLHASMSGSVRFHAY